MRHNSDLEMDLHSPTKSLLRKTLLVGWAIAVLWIYVGNLVNFHQHHIWGKQLIPVACSSTRVKEKEAVAGLNHNSNSKVFDTGLQFDFSTPSNQISDIPQHEIKSFYFIPTDTPLLHLGIRAFSLRGPPLA